MCTNHDQRHYPRALAQIAYIMAGQDAALRDAILVAATHAGLEALASTPSLRLEPLELVRVRSRLEAARAGLESERRLLRKAVADRHNGHGCDYDEPPF